MRRARIDITGDGARLRAATTHALSTVFAFAGLAAAACGGSDPAQGDGGSGGTAPDANETEAGPGTTDGADTSDADASSSSGGELGSGRVAASGVRVAWVEANQGTGIRLGDEWLVYPPEDRDAKLLAGRPTLVRAGWMTDEGFSPRAIAAELRLVEDDGSEVRLVDVRDVGAEDPQLPWTTTFQWRLEADRLDADTQYVIELYEVDPVPDPSAAADEPPAFPPNGEPTPFGIDVSPHRLEITLVPVAYDDGQGCVTLPEITSEYAEYVREQIYMVHSVQEVTLTVSEPLAYMQRLDHWSDLNDRLAEFRMTEGIAAQQYVAAVADLCGAYPDGRSGAAYGILDRADEELAFARVASALWASREWTARTLAKFLGHLHGRPAISCDGTAHDDPSYPDPAGAIDPWGWGVLDGGLRDPAIYTDVMSTCSPWWIGNHGWAALEPFIAAVSSWTADQGAPAQDGELLVLRVAGDGRASWTRLAGSLGSAADPDAVVAIATDDGIERRPALRIEEPEGGGYRVVTELAPSDAERARSLTYAPPGGGTPVALPELRGALRWP